VKLRIYLDTSVISALHDSRDIARQSETVAFWAKLDQYDASASELTRQELEQVASAVLRQQFQDSLRQITLHAVTQDMRDLANQYVSAGVFSTATHNDALHVVAAVLTRQDVLVSWNFKHLVNRRRRAMVNQVNVLSGLPTIDVVAPPEM
jgi:predicted nucleic acid-binding protein